MVEKMQAMTGFLPVPGKATGSRFDDGALSSDARYLALRKAEQRLDTAGRLAPPGARPEQGEEAARSDVCRFADQGERVADPLGLVVRLSVGVVEKLRKVARQGLSPI